MKSERDKITANAKGFTIVELLTVMSVIAILIALLVPALGLVKDYAKEVQQRSQFHAIEVGLELFSKDFGSYPDSMENQFSTTPVVAPVTADPSNYCGANKLAEAMVGLDFFGVHPDTAFRSDNMNWRTTQAGGLEGYRVYHPDTDDMGNPLHMETAEENVDARKGPYLDLENANAFPMTDVYQAGTLGGVGAGFNTTSNPANNDFPSLVLCDVYSEKRPSGKKTGMPILYYRARRAYREQDWESNPNGRADDVYLYDDNFHILQLGTPENQLPHPLADGASGNLGTAIAGSVSNQDVDDFQRMIVNNKITSIKTPFRKDSYILISAGKDGVYGSPDDITNFTRESDQ